MSHNAVSFDLQALVSRVKQWLAEGKDVRVCATRPAVRGFPMIDMRDDRAVEVVSSAGIIRESTDPRSSPSPGTPKLMGNSALQVPGGGRDDRAHVNLDRSNLVARKPHVAHVKTTPAVQTVR
jgi:hypothetical protein